MNVWEELPTGIHTPKRLAKKVPLFEVIKEYRLKTDSEILSVERTFASCVEGLRLDYKGKNLEECVTIEGGIIRSVSTAPPLDEEFLKSLSSEDEKIGYIFSSRMLKQKTYNNIKRFEDRLKELPWQSDLAAIYNGSGVFLIKG